MRGDSYNPSAAGNGYMSRDIYDAGPGSGMPIDERGADLNAPAGAAAWNDFRKRRRTPSPPGGARHGGRYDPRPRYFAASGPPPGAGGPPAPYFEDRGGYRGGYDPRGDYRGRERDMGRERDFGAAHGDRHYVPGFGARRSMSPRRGYDSYGPPQDIRYPYASRNEGARPFEGGPGADGLHAGNAVGGIRPPNELEESVSLRDFTEWYRTTHADELKPKDETDAEPLNGEAIIEQKYAEYRKDFLVRQNWALFLEHRNQTWFIEKYGVDEAMQQLRLNASRHGRVPAVRKYIDELEKGTWDEVNYDASADPKEVRKTKDGREANGIGKTLEPIENKMVELPAPANQIFIKSIPPNIGRHALEAFLPSQPGFEYLAMSEPYLKKGCHRVGYVQFKEGTDVRGVLNAIDRTEVKDFTLHMNVNILPFSSRTRANPTVSGTLARMKHDAVQAKAMALSLEDQLLMSENERKAALEEGKSLGEVAKKEARILSRGSDVVAARIETLTKGLEETETDESKSESEIEREKVRIELDQWVSYLRNGLNSCYYCVAPMDFPEELYQRCLRHIRKVGDSNDEEHRDDEDEEQEMEAEPRPIVTTDVDGTPLDIKMRPRPKVVDPAEKWTSRLDSKIKLIILPRSELDIKEYYGKDRDEEINKIAKPLIKEEETNKYRCKNCSKLFKAPEFVHKHLTTKHPELFEHLNQDLPLFDNFILDPKHIIPLMDQPASVHDKPASRPLHPPYDALSATSGRSRGRNNFGDRGGRGGRTPGNRGGFGAFNSPRGGYRGSRDVPMMGSPMTLTPGKEDPRAKRGRISYRDLDAAPPASTASGASANTEGGGLDY
ncbi:hypothetical protein NliqN6_0384 [Naganishia liquefaciens]|uniref:C2H2-type domain-containing protein n=1 Tax=Naganishia liquefaciens TaxID=104408 RepID=A0A8H3YD62_9TREE|nr:hypothetical protein NliqN6_0384 [Naganishia liquefaciens]